MSYVASTPGVRSRPFGATTEAAMGRERRMNRQDDSFRSIARERKGKEAGRGGDDRAPSEAPAAAAACNALAAGESAVFAIV